MESFKCSDSVESIDITGLTNLKTFNAVGSGNVVVYVAKDSNVDMTGNVVKKYVVSDGVKLDTTAGSGYKFAVVVDTFKYGGSKDDGALYIDEVDVIVNDVKETMLENYVEADDNIEFRVNFTSPTNTNTIRGQVQVKEWNSDKTETVDDIIYYVTKAFTVATSGNIKES